MTLVAAWLRQNKTLRELVIASDSRISGSESWDACPKLMPLPRPATLMAMSGDAVEAYAFLIQAINTCRLLNGHETGQTDIAYLARKLRDVYGDSRRHVTDLDSGGKVSIPNLDVVLFGWSWRRLRFEGYSYKFNKFGQLWMNDLQQLMPEGPYPIYLFGDAAPTARRRLKALIDERGLPRPHRGDPEAKRVAADAFLDWEPLEVLLDVIGDRGVRTVGGTPQVTRIYQYGDVETFVWRDGQGADYYGGRPVLQAERFDRRVMQFLDGTVQISMSDHSLAYGGRTAAVLE